MFYVKKLVWGMAEGVSYPGENGNWIWVGKMTKVGRWTSFYFIFAQLASGNLMNSVYRMRQHEY
jgi:hypothetical protein